MSLVWRLLAAIAAMGLLASACGSDNDDDRSLFGPTGTAMATNTASSAPAIDTATPTADIASRDGGDIAPTTDLIPEQNGSSPLAPTSQLEELTLVLTPVASLPDPMALVARPETGGGTGDLYVGTRDGRVWLLSADEDEPPETVLDITDLTEAECENGLLDIDFSPDGSTLYVHYTDLPGDNQIVAYPMNGQWVGSDQGRTVLTVDQPFCNHNGGDIAFGPDGNLWIGLGDGGGRDDHFGHGQNLDSLLAAIVRIDPETGGEAAYAIPADNPFADGGARPEIWAYGARNPWRFSFDRATGDLWIGDVGQDNWEEIHVLRAADGWAPGANMGWPLFEGRERYLGAGTPDDLVFPEYVYHHDDGCSITGGYVYRGSAIPSLVGTYVFADYCQGRLWGLTIDDQGAATRREIGLSVPPATLVSFGEDAAGELYVLSFDDTVYRLESAR